MAEGYCGAEDLGHEGNGRLEFRHGQPDVVDAAGTVVSEQAHSQTLPPLTPSTRPVTWSDSSETRKSKALRRSAGVAMRGTD